MLYVCYVERTALIGKLQFTLQQFVLVRVSATLANPVGIDFPHFVFLDTPHTALSFFSQCQRHHFPLSQKRFLQNQYQNLRLASIVLLYVLIYEAR